MVAPQGTDPIVTANAERIRAVITKAQSLYAAGSSYTKAKATAARTLLTPQVVAAATAQDSALGAKLQAAITAAASALSNADANATAADATFANFTTALEAFQRR